MIYILQIPYIISRFNLEEIILKRCIHEQDEILFACFCPVEYRNIITAAITTKDITKRLVRTKSSNVWAYAMNVDKYGDVVGDMFAQFKGKNGGPGDIYIYYDVPVKLYRRWVVAPSKGHFFWKYFRNNFKYSKLTGDKKGKLPNAIN